MTLQSLINFYDSYLRNNSNQVCSNPDFKSAINGQVNDIDVFWKSQEYKNQKLAEISKEDGNQFVKNNNIKEAIECYKRALKLKPDYVDVYYNLAKTYKSINDNDDAIEAYNKLLELSPNDVEALTNLGECYKDINDFTNAAKYYKTAVNIDPKYDMAIRSLKEIENLKLAQTNPALADEKNSNMLMLT